MKLSYLPVTKGWTLILSAEELEELMVASGKALRGDKNFAEEALKDKKLRQPYCTLGVFNKLCRDGVDHIKNNS